MKKLLSLLLVAVILFVACVPAFAEELVIDKESASQWANADVSADGTVYEEWYVVRIPTLIYIRWDNTDPVSADYEYASQLSVGKSLLVNAVVNSNGQMTSTTFGDPSFLYFKFYENGTETLSVTRTHGAANGAGSIVDGNIVVTEWASTNDLTVKIPSFEIQSATTFTPDAYQGTLTYQIQLQ